MIVKIELTSVFLTLGDIDDYLPKDSEDKCLYSWDPPNPSGAIHRDKVVKIMEHPGSKYKATLVQITGTKIYLVIHYFGGFKGDWRMEMTRQGFYSDSLVDAKKHFLNIADNE